MNSVKQLYDADKTGQFVGKDSKGVPKIKYLQKIVGLDDTEFEQETTKIVHRWIRTGRKRTDHFWKMNACYFEHLRRGSHKQFQEVYRKLCKK